MKPKIIRLKLCTFLQLVTIALEYKRVAHDLEYLADPPDWCLTLSPRRNVPVLQVGDEVLFKSTAINEFVDETHEPRLNSDDLILRARNWTWIEFNNGWMWHVSI